MNTTPEKSFKYTQHIATAAQHACCLHDMHIVDVRLFHAEFNNSKNKESALGT